MKKLTDAILAVIAFSIYVGLIMETMAGMAGVDIRQVFAGRQYETLDCVDLIPQPPITPDFIGTLLPRPPFIIEHLTIAPPPASVAVNNGDEVPPLSWAAPAGDSSPVGAACKSADGSAP